VVVFRQQSFEVFLDKEQIGYFGYLIDVKPIYALHHDFQYDAHRSDPADSRLEFFTSATISASVVGCTNFWGLY
jgi:hypothetical protein